MGDENAPATPGDDLAPAGGSPVPSGTAPSTGVHMDESEFKEWVHHALEGAHVIGDSAEVLGLLAQAAGAGQHSALVIMGETLGPIGMIASTVIVIGATIHAFGTGKRLQEQEGFCYGVMWEVYGLPNADKTFIDWFDDSAEELRESFYEGVASGREKGAETEIRNRVILATVYYQAAGDDLATAQAKVLNDIWQKVRETDKGRDWLGWPEPVRHGYLNDADAVSMIGVVERRGIIVLPRRQRSGATDPPCAGGECDGQDASRRPCMLAVSAAVRSWPLTSRPATGASLISALNEPK